MEESESPFGALQAAIEKLGSQVALARLCGVRQPSVWGWLHRMKRLPAEHVLAVEAATGVSRHKLRPDIYPIEKARPTPCPAGPTPAADDAPRLAAGDSSLEEVRS